MKKKTKNKLIIIGVIIAIVLLLLFGSGFINLSVANDRVSCNSNNDCYDSNPKTNDICLNPGSTMSSCNMTGVIDEKS